MTNYLIGLVIGSAMTHAIYWLRLGSRFADYMRRKAS